VGRVKCSPFRGLSIPKAKSGSGARWCQRLSISKRNGGKTERARQHVSSVYSTVLSQKSTASRAEGPKLDLPLRPTWPITSFCSSRYAGPLPRPSKYSLVNFRANIKPDSALVQFARLKMACRDRACRFKLLRCASKCSSRIQNPFCPGKYFGRIL
jgi:hypothetical protein